MEQEAEFQTRPKTLAERPDPMGSHRRGPENSNEGRPTSSPDAQWKTFFPLTHLELGDSFDLNQVLRWGSLPEMFFLDETTRDATLRTDANTYLKEEIQFEQLVRKIAAQLSGKQVNFSKIPRDIGSDSVSP